MRVAVPLAPMVVGAFILVVGLTLSAVTGSWVAFVAVMGAGISVGLVLGVRLGLRVRQQVEASVVAGQPRSWIQYIWPRWAVRTFKAYMVAWGAITALGVVLLIIAAALDAAK